MFRGKDMANPARYAKDLLADRDLRFISRTFPLWVAAGLALPFGLGVALTGTLAGGLTGLLWGGAVRIFLLHHVDLQHQLAVPLLRPAAVRHRRRVAQPRLARAARLRRGVAQQPPRLPDLGPARPGPPPDRPGAWLIAGLERCHLAWDVIRISPTRQQAKAGSTAT